MAHPLVGDASAEAPRSLVVAMLAEPGALVGEDGRVPFGCPFLALTGWACPLCGGTRSTLELAHGDVGAAMDLNAFTTIGLLLVAGVWASRLPARWRGQPWAPVLPPAGWRAVGVLGVALAVAFTVVRNLPGPGGVLAP